MKVGFYVRKENGGATQARKKKTGRGEIDDDDDDACFAGLTMHTIGNILGYKNVNTALKLGLVYICQILHCSSAEKRNESG